VWAEEAFEPEPNFVWASVDELNTLMSESECFNPDLRSLLVLFDWNRIPGLANSDQIPDPKSLSTTSDSSQFVNYSYERNHGSHFVNYSIVPIRDLKRWKVTDDGILDTASEGLHVRMYDIYCQTRENPHWTQPLMESSSEGLVQLGIRNSGVETEYLLTHHHCMGVGPQGVMLPSVWRYPGQSNIHGTLLSGTVTHEFVQSDEGGRFIHHTNRYQVVETDRHIELSSGQLWVTETQLRSLLRTSNLIGFSLRIALSALLQRFTESAR
jgi:hypothetical protein